MKNKQTKIIIIVAAVLLVVAGAVVGIVGYNAGWFSPKDELISKVIYDETGTYVEREEFYNRDDVLQYMVVKGYSDSEKTKLSRETYKNADDKVTKIVYYNDSGKITSVDEYDGKSPQPSVHREYKDGVATGNYFTYEYTDDGLNLLNTVEYDVNGEVVKKVKREYNTDGKIILYLETGKDDNQIAKTVYEYNADGQESKVTFYDGEGETGYVDYEYDKDGNRTRMNEYVNGELISYRTYTYDENGNVHQETHDPAEEK